MVQYTIGSGLLRRHDSLLLVRGRYSGQAELLWTLPGGRQEPGESLAQTVIREFAEETSLVVGIDKLAYVSESVDDVRQLHVLNVTFWVTEPDPTIAPRSTDAKVTEVRFVPVTDAPELLRADVLRVPVGEALQGKRTRWYYSFNASNITVPFFSS